MLVHHDRAVLDGWRHEIEEFLGKALRLSLKADIRLRPLTAGIDFLGYVVYPTHTRVRRRVLNHAREALAAWASIHIDGAAIATPASYRELRSTSGPATKAICAMPTRTGSPRPFTAVCPGRHR